MKSKTWSLLGYFILGFLPTAFSQNFDVYVSDAGNFNLPPWQILKFDQNGENGEVFISDHLAWPQDIVFIEDQNLVLVSNLNTNVISKFDASTGEYLGEFATGIAGPTRMEIRPDSLLYVLQWTGNGKVKRYHLDGSFVDDFTATGVGNSIGLDWDAEGNLYVSSYNGKYVRKFSPTGADLGNFISTNLAGPTNIWFADNGDLLVNDWNAGAIKRFGSDGSFIGVFATGVPQVEGVDFFPNGDIAVGCGGAGTVKVFSPEGVFVKDLFPPGTLNAMTPNAVVFRDKAASPAKETVQEVNFVQPTLGVRFQISNPSMGKRPEFYEVFDSTGALVERINYTEAAVWEASAVGNGIYYITAKLRNGTVARQKVVVQK
jgi:WD40 repeat protein